MKAITVVLTMARLLGLHISTGWGANQIVDNLKVFWQIIPGVCDIWMGGHTHTNPEDTTGGRSHVEQKWGGTFINVAAISKFHGQKNVPMSRVLTFTEGCDQVDVKCYLHSDHFAPQGWYEPARRTVPLKMPFSL